MLQVIVMLWNLLYCIHSKRPVENYGKSSVFTASYLRPIFNVNGQQQCGVVQQAFGQEALGLFPYKFAIIIIFRLFVWFDSSVAIIYNFLMFSLSHDQPVFWLWSALKLSVVRVRVSKQKDWRDCLRKFRAKTVLICCRWVETGRDPPWQCDPGRKLWPPWYQLRATPSSKTRWTQPTGSDFFSLKEKYCFKYTFYTL